RFQAHRSVDLTPVVEQRHCRSSCRSQLAPVLAEPGFGVALGRELRLRAYRAELDLEFGTVSIQIRPCPRHRCLPFKVPVPARLRPAPLTMTAAGSVHRRVIAS